MARGIYDVDANNIVDTVQAFNWADVTDKPTVFPPIMPHPVPHQINEITGLSTILATFVTTETLPDALAGTYYTSAQVDSLLATKAAVIHFHDDRYYLKPYIDQITSASGVDRALALYGATQPLAHSHDDRYYDKTYIDNIFNASNLNLVNDARYYTKPEVDQAIATAPYLTPYAASLTYYNQDQINAFLAGLGDGLYVFTASTPMIQWNVTHGLGRYPTVNVAVSGELALAKVVYPDTDHITVSFYTPTSGFAYLT
jgi:hypothetical protein